jgi:type II secretory pathway pseudopilin PulG
VSLAYKSQRRDEQGYILLTLLLIVSLMIIATAVIVPSIAFEIRREREMELVHRGVQYTRAIRLFSKRNGRYPSRPEELLGQQDVRYIRKLYKDPITGKDFRLLHLGDIQPTTNPNALGTPIGAAADSSPDQSGQPSAPSPGQSEGQLPQSPSGDAGANPAAAPPPPPPDPAQGPVVNFGQSNARFANQASVATGFGTAASAFSSAPPSDGPQPGLLIFGVASTSKAHSIRAFDHKEHYNEWWFFYDPRFDRGYAIKGPTSMSMPTFQNPALAGQSLNGQTLNGQSLNGAQPSQPQTFQFQTQQTQQPPPQQPAPETQQNPPQ